MKKHMRHLRFVSIFLIVLLIISGNMVFANQFVENANAESNPEEQVDVVEDLSYPLIVQEEPTSGISETGEESQGEDIVTPLEPDVDSSATVILDSNSGDLPEPILLEAGNSLDEMPVLSKNVEENTALNANEEDQPQDSETVVGELTIINVDIVEFVNSGNTIEDIKIGDPYVLSTKVISGEVGQSWLSEAKEDIAGMEYFSRSYGDSDDYDDNYGYFAEGKKTLVQFYQPIVSIEVTKAWADGDNQDGVRPESVTIMLLADGVETDKTLTLTASNNWTGTFSALDEYANGELINYTVEEVAIENGYEASVTGTAADGYTVINSRMPETIAVEGSKAWDDYDDQDGKRPESITIRLLKNGEEIDSKIITEDDDWVWSFADLAKYEDGELITYTVVEDPVDDYITIYVSDYNVINSRMPSKTSVEVTKVWSDGDNQDGMRPESVTIMLLADGVETDKTLILTASNNWTGTFSDLDEYAKGELITYTVEEVAIGEGYTSVVTGDQEAGYKVTNIRTPNQPTQPTTQEEPSQPTKPSESKLVSPVASTGESLTMYGWIGALFLGLGLFLIILKREYRLRRKHE